MSEKTNGANWNKSSQAKERRKRVILRLETQLTGPAMLSKDQSDRINRELITLRTRI